MGSHSRTGRPRPISSYVETNGSADEGRRRLEDRASRDFMSLLTLGLTHEGDTFLIGAGAVLLFVLLYPLVGGWALLSFPIVFAVAVLARSK